MSEKIYQQVEKAIEQHLYCANSLRWNGSPAWITPIRIEHGNIVLLWGDCGNPNRAEDLTIWTTDEWLDAVGEDGRGLFRKVGFWSFEPANDPAADCIAFCHQYPDAAGRELYRLRELCSSNQQN